jgi:2-polyprenyl-6-methoxyphenol hydroxylase-like FAD-dependent oxidoreductase
MRRVLIIGGGVAGLAAAASFAAEGWETTVCEKNAGLRANGNGFPIFPNGARVLTSVAGRHAVETAGWRLDKLQIRNSAGKDVVAFDASRTVGTEGLAMFTRQSIIDLLAGAAKQSGAVLEGGRTLVKVHDGRVAEFEDGETVEADLIVGADGIFSRVRRSIMADVPLKDHRKGAVRTLIPYTPDDFEQSPLREGFEYNDPSGRRVGLYPVSATQMYMLLVFLREDTEVQGLPVDPELWNKTFVTLEKFLRRIGSDAHKDFYHSVEPPRWSSGRVAIVGDAAHGMTPALGQGANTSLMTGYSLGKCVGRGDDIEASLRRWEKMMRPLVGFVQRYAEGMTAGRFDPQNDIFFTEPVIEPLLQADVPGIFA